MSALTKSSNRKKKQKLSDSEWEELIKSWSCDICLNNKLDCKDCRFEFNDIELGVIQ